ncbi:putative transporter [Thermoascus aurantiacus ATCC 26904]
MGSSSAHSDSGIQKANIFKRSWTKQSLVIAFSGLFLCTLIINFSNYSTQVYEPYITSAFKQHSAMSAARVVVNITVLAYPIIAKLGNAAEMFIFSISVQILGFILYAIFDTIGLMGFIIIQQVFIADATNLINRALWSMLPDSLTTIPTLYLGTIVGEDMLSHSSWRWGWGMWAIILPFCAVPLVATMIILQRRASKNGLSKTQLSTITGCAEDNSLWRKMYQLLWVQLDLPGAFFLVAGMSLFLIPLWSEPLFIAMLVLGVVLAVVFIVWDSVFAKKPFIPYRMVRNRTVGAACLLGALDFFHYAVFTIFFPSYLQVVGRFSPGHATRIDNSLRVAFQVSGIVASLLMKYSKRSQICALIGVPMCVLGQGILIYLIDMGNGRTGNEASFVAAKSLIGVGRGFYQTASQVSVQAVVSKQELAVVTAVFFASMSVGGAIGTSVSGAIWRSQLPAKLREYLPAEIKSQAPAIFKSIVNAQKYAKGTAGRTAIDRSYRESQQILAIAGIAALAPMVILMLLLKNVHLDKEEEEAATNVAQDPRSLDTKEAHGITC